MGPRGDYAVQRESHMGFARIFDNVWGGKRHAMVGPTQIDRFGQANISMIGSDYRRPKSMMLGVRGFPGNSINHANSFFVPNQFAQGLRGRRGRHGGLGGLQPGAAGARLEPGRDRHPPRRSPTCA
jgi:acyl CoA:acetate/3-ketoacid CoA transferase beta subunit